MPPSPHMTQRTVPLKDNSEHRVKQLRGEDLHCKCCCDLGLEETMARVSGERAPAFTSEELEKLVDGVLPSTHYSTVLQTNSIIRRRSSGTGAQGGCIPHGHGGPHYGIGLHQWDGGRGELHDWDRSCDQ
ncbi:hypothetical protein NDU88_007648 [Pleurodeles waltl]|uniref:Uncharacterized protein n=1 Tax=Pleurodeles waltl TaxID=8319 RepID=A0AAV7NYK0_PLEWA|nr:hypothetical protein NDU88_007648 [Pleurodeles waltl]